MNGTQILAALLILACPVGAYAQGSDRTAGDAVPPTVADNALAGDFLILGLGAAYRSSYEGSDDYIVNPAPLLRGSLDGFEFEARGPGLAVDLVRDAPRRAVDFAAGPQFRVNLNRVSQIEDPVVRLLGDRKAAIEGGGFVGVSFNGVTNRFDTVMAQIDVLTDLGDVHNGTLISPSLSWATPLSRALFASVSVSATYADAAYMRSEFGVTAAGAAASGLPAFDPDGGWKNVGSTALFGFDLSGNALDGGWGLFALTSYSRLLEDAARSPIVRLRGDRDQWFGAVGVSYAF